MAPQTATDLGPRAAATPRVSAAGCLTVLDEWELVTLADQGNFADIYLARPADGGDDQPAQYAVKVLRPQWQHHADAVQMLAREALVTRQVKHPNVVSVLSARVSGRPQYLVMPWLRGTTLGRLFAAGRCWAVPEAVWIARQACEGLTAIHTAGWLHGDIKPANLLVADDGHVTLMDLGLARRPDDAAADNRAMGTPLYLAPECKTPGGRADFRSDLFSLGLVLWEMLAAHCLVSAATPGSNAGQPAVARPSTAEIQALARALDMPPALVALLQQSLANDPWRRPQSAVEVARRLAAVEIATFACRAW